MIWNYWALVGGVTRRSLLPVFMMTTVITLIELNIRDIQLTGGGYTLAHKFIDRIFFNKKSFV